MSQAGEHGPLMAGLQHLALPVATRWRRVGIVMAGRTVPSAVGPPDREFTCEGRGAALKARSQSPTFATPENSQ
jgi:hypothetical protein